ncbi:MAG: glycosyltransferase family 4 protein, partial [Planctomycetota bacterium]
FHLEHGFFRLWEISSAGPSDAWIASSNYTRELYLKAGISADRVFLSYYGNLLHSLPPEGAALRNRYNISKDKFVVGNVNYMYVPKIYLGQTRGIKRHEDVIDAIARVISTRRDAVGILVGGQWGSGDWYERRLKERALKRGRGRIIMTGKLPASQAKAAWIDFDVALHVPVSENCGGVVEPLLAAVPVIAARTGGLPEVVLPGVTGKLVAPCDPVGLAAAIVEVLDDLNRYREMAHKGTRLVRNMFDVRRTAEEIEAIYSHVRDYSVPKPEFFNSRAYLKRLYGKAE